MASRVLPLIAVIALVASSHYALAQTTVTADKTSEITSTTELTTPKANATKSFVGTQKATTNISEGDGTADDSNASAAASPAGVAPGAELFNKMFDHVDSTISAVQQHVVNSFKKAGVTSDRYEALTQHLKASIANCLAVMDAAKSATEKTLKGYYGLLLDNTGELRTILQDGDTVIASYHKLRGDECTDPSFTPPVKKYPRITGAAATYSVTTGGCQLTRDAKPLQLDYVLKCTEPAVTYEYKAARYTSKYVSAAKAKTKECKHVRKYGVESETRITLLDPAAFFTAAEPDAEAESGLPNDASGLNKAAAWYKGMFPVNGNASQKFQFVPGGVREAVAKAIKDVTVEMSLNYKPFSVRNDFQQAAEFIAQAVSDKLEVNQKLMKIHQAKLDSWMNPETRDERMSDLNFADNLRDSLSNMNVSSLFDGVFAKTASKLMARSPMAGQMGNGKLAAAAAGAVNQFTSERPLRALLMKAREGAGEPVSVKLSTTLGSAMKSAQVNAADIVGDGDGGAGSLLGSLLQQDPSVGARLKQLADMLGTATAGLQSARAQSG